MYSRCRSADALLILALISATGGCQREDREFNGPAPRPSGSAHATPTTAFEPGPTRVESHALGRHFEGNAYHVNQGQQLYKWFNCTGCHANGGGAIGPALMDAEWRYGGSIEQIHASIVEGRPNGMPSFGGRIPDDQIWQIAAFIRTMSGNAPKYVAGGGRQGMAVAPPLSRLPKLPPRTTGSDQ